MGCTQSHRASKINSGVKWDERGPPLDSYPEIAIKQQEVFQKQTSSKSSQLSDQQKMNSAPRVHGQEKLAVKNEGKVSTLHQSGHHSRLKSSGVEGSGIQNLETDEFGQHVLTVRKQNLDIIKDEEVGNFMPGQRNIDIHVNFER